MYVSASRSGVLGGALATTGAAVQSWLIAGIGRAGDDGHAAVELVHVSSPS